MTAVILVLLPITIFAVGFKDLRLDSAENVQKAELHYVTPLQPNSVAVLILFPGCNGDGKTLIQKREWLDYAASKNIAASASNVVLLSPAFYPHEFGFDTDTTQRTEILFGEFSQSPFLLAWEETGRVRRVNGVGDYFPDWPNALFGLHIRD